MQLTSAFLFGLSTLPRSLGTPVAATDSSKACTPKLLVNGGFETGSLSPWISVTEPYAGDNTSITVISPGYKSKYAGNLLTSVSSSNSQDSSEMYQYFGPLCAGQTYTINILYKISKQSKGTANAFLSLLELAQPTAKYLFEQSINLAGATTDSLGNAYGAWHSLSYSFQPNANQLRVAFSALADASSAISIAFDNVTVK